MKKTQRFESAKYQSSLLTSFPAKSAVEAFCKESQDDIYQFLSDHHSVDLLVAMMMHREGKVIALSYTVKNTEDIEKYDFRNLDRFVKNGRIAPLIEFFGAILEINAVRDRILANNQAEKQLSEMVNEYRDSNKNFFEAFIRNKTFYLYFQKECFRSCSD